LAGSRSYKLGGDGLRTSEIVRLPSTPSGVEPPDPPAWIAGDAELVECYRELWQEPIAVTWAASDREQVARLALLRRKIAREADDASASLFAAVGRLESELSLGPRARRLAGVAIEPPPRQQPSSSDAGLTKADAEAIAAERAKLGIVPTAKKPVRKRKQASPARRRPRR
jgi:hypothetical protein